MKNGLLAKRRIVKFLTGWEELSLIDAFEAEGAFLRGNLHGHSSNSDGVLEPEAVCGLYRDHGYDFVSVTDHFREAYGFPVTDTRAFRDGAFTTIVGAELHGPVTSRGVDWHILAVGLPLDFAPPGEGESGPELARRAADAGAFVGIAHPHWYQLQIEDGEALKAAEAVEVYNHTNQVNTDRGDGLVFYDAMLSRGHRLNCIAVDDSHMKADDTFGGWVMVKSARNTPEALLAALKAGEFYSSQGPEIHQIAFADDHVVVRCSPAETVMLVGPASLNERVHGRSLTSARLKFAKFGNSWCRAVVVDRCGRRAWSNPHWFSGDPQNP